MKTDPPSPIRLFKSCLPDEIYLSFEPFETDIKKTDLDVLQNLSGRNLLKRMSDHFMGGKDLHIFTEKNEKPEAYCSGKQISASFSHTSDGVAAALSADFNVGCDMEIADRDVHPKLVKRMKHEQELPNVYEKNEVVQIWTLKEAALKMIGTGLRKPMKSVEIRYISSGRFHVHFDDEKEANICSFKHQNHYITVCYRAL